MYFEYYIIKLCVFFKSDENYWYFCFSRQSNWLGSDHKFQPMSTVSKIISIFKAFAVLLGSLPHLCHSVVSLGPWPWSISSVLTVFICWLESDSCMHNSGGAHLFIDHFMGFPSWVLLSNLPGCFYFPCVPLCGPLVWELGFSYPFCHAYLWLHPCLSPSGRGQRRNQMQWRGCPTL